MPKCMNTFVYNHVINTMLFNLNLNNFYYLIPPRKVFRLRPCLRILRWYNNCIMFLTKYNSDKIDTFQWNIFPSKYNSKQFFRKSMLQNKYIFSNKMYYSPDYCIRKTILSRPRFIFVIVIRLKLRISQNTRS